MRVQLKQVPVLLPLAFAVIAIAATLSLRSANWIGDPLWGQEKVGIAQVLVLPLLGAGAAVTGWRDRHGVLSLLTTGRQRATHLGYAFAAWALLLAILYGLSAVGVNALSATSDPFLHNWSAWPLATQWVAGLVAVCVGYLVGQVLDSWLGSVVAAVLLACVLILDRMGVITTGLAEYAASGTMLGADPSPGYFLMRLAWMLLLGVIVVAALVAGPSSSARWTAGVLVVLMATGSVAFRTNNSYEIHRSPDAFCSASTVRVCAPTTFAGRADQAGAIASRAAEVLQRYGADAPAQLLMWQPGVEDRDWVMLVNPGLLRDRLRPADVVSAVVSPKGCRIWRDADHPPSSAWFYADSLVHSVVESTMTGAVSRPLSDLRQSYGTSGAAALVGAAARALQACDQDAIPATLAQQAAR